jgi:predicted alpha-1,2-mannosidase
MDRSKYYKNLYDANSGFFRAKNDKNAWIEPFSPLNYGANGGNPYTEGNAWQYLWYVPQDIPSLISLIGGKSMFIKRLDSLFTLKDSTVKLNDNASGLIGQYAHGNEPSHHIAYLYDYAGVPWKTQFYTHKILQEMYNDSFSGYAGNEDCGQMASWYIFSAMGFYPVNPANGIFAIGSPLLQQATINLPSGKTFTVNAKNVSNENIYIQSATLNGRPFTHTYLTIHNIQNGGKLVFIMGDKPNKKWGTNKEDIPPYSIFNKN